MRCRTETTSQQRPPTGADDSEHLRTPPPGHLPMSAHVSRKRQRSWLPAARGHLGARCLEEAEDGLRVTCESCSSSEGRLPMERQPSPSRQRLPDAPRMTQRTSWTRRQRVVPGERKSKLYQVSLLIRLGRPPSSHPPDRRQQPSSGRRGAAARELGRMATAQPTAVLRTAAVPKLGCVVAVGRHRR